MDDVPNTNTVPGTVFGDVIQAGAVNKIVMSTRPPEVMGGVPAQQCVFVGRRDLLAELVGKLRPDVRKGEERASASTVIVLSGQPGVGKTALAIEVANTVWNKKWCRGVLHVDLHGDERTGAVDPHAALALFLVRLGVDRDQVPHDPATRQGMYLTCTRAWADGGSRILVMLDGVESADQVAALDPGPGHAVIAVSRHTLPEVVGAEFEVDVLEPHESVRLLSEALSTARGEDDRVSREPEAAAELAELCDHLPFALTVAATILKDEPRKRISHLVTELRQAADDRLERLSFGQRAVSALFDLSYQRLKPRQQRMFRLLCLYSGPHVSEEAASALTGSGWTALKALERAHLVKPASQGSGFVVYDLMRLYGRKRAEQEESEEAVRTAVDRLFEHYRTITAKADGSIRQGARSDRFATREGALGWLDAERYCLLAAVQQGHETGRDADTIDLALRLRYFFELRRHWDDWVNTFGLALACARRAGERDAEARLLEALGDAFRLQRAEELALAHYEQARQVYLDLGDRRGLDSITDSVMSIVSRWSGHLEEAVQHYRNAVHNYRERGENRRLADALNNLGLTYLELGEHTRAVEAHSEELALREEMPDPREQACTLTNLGNVHRAQGLLDTAIRRYTKAAELFHTSDDRDGRAEALANLGAVHLEAGRTRDARKCWTSSIELFSTEEDRDVVRDRLRTIRTVARWRNRAWAGTLEPYAYVALFVAVAAWEAWSDAPDDQQDQPPLQQLGVAASVAVQENGAVDSGGGADGGADGGEGAGGHDTSDRDGEDDDAKQNREARRPVPADTGGYGAPTSDYGGGGGGDYGGGDGGGGYGGGGGDYGGGHPYEDERYQNLHLFGG